MATVGELRELIKGLPDDTVICVSDMDNHDFYDMELVKHDSRTDEYDYDELELILPIYINDYNVEDEE